MWNIVSYFGKNKKNKTAKVVMYVVINKNTEQCIGVFDTLEAAIEGGRKTTYCNSEVYKFNVNDKCTFMNSPVHDDDK